MPTISQMKARSLGHADVLRRIADGRPLLPPNAAPSQFRGMSTMRSTLLKWGCIIIVKGDRDEHGRPTYRHEITETGRALLAGLETRS